MAEKKKPGTDSKGNEKKGGSRKEHLKSLSPLLAVVVVAACVGSSIAGYVPASYDIPEVVEAAAEEEEETAEKGSFALEDGYYEGTGVGYSGDVVVGVTIASQQITGIDVLEESDDDSFFSRALAVIDSIIEQQSLEVDVVSGATYSSNGIINAVKNALTGEEDDSEIAEAAGEGDTEVEEVEEADGYIDGTYYGSAQGFSGTVTVKVVIEDGKIASITVVSHSDDSSYFNKAKTLISKIISGQTTNVDVVSGASYSSAGIINAVRNALSQAAVSGSSETAGETAVNTSSASDTTKKRTVTAGTGGNFPYPDGTYTGTAEGFEGDITVAVTLKDASIVKVEITASEDDEPYITNASVLLDEVVTAQSTNLDVVSGATYSSKGILSAIDNALAAAKAAADSADSSGTSGSGSSSSESTDNEDTDSADSSESEMSDSGDETEDSGESASSYTYADGTYTYRVTVDPLDSSYIDEYEDEADAFTAYTLTVNVTIESDTVSAITFSGASSSNKSYCNLAKNGLMRKLASLTGESLTVSAVESLDAVSGATCSSKAMQEAIADALNDAAAAQEEALSALGLDAAKAEESAIAE